MPYKQYMCRLVPSLKLSGGIRFVNGYFGTDSPLEQKTVEDNDWFGAHIKLLPAPLQTLLAAEAKPDPVQDDDDGLGDVMDIATVAAGSTAPEAPPKLTATVISRLKVDELAAELRARGVPTTKEDGTQLPGHALRMALRRHLGV